MLAKILTVFIAAPTESSKRMVEEKTKHQL